MKSKTSITLSRTLLDEIRQTLGEKTNRPRLIEVAVREYLARTVREARDTQELELLNRHSTALNKEAADVLSYQVKL